MAHRSLNLEGPPAEHPDGEAYTLLQTAHFHMARTLTRRDRPHYHRRATEIYLVLSGRGRMEVDDKEEELYRGVCIKIMPNTRHHATTERGQLDMIVFSFPPVTSDDIFYNQ